MEGQKSLLGRLISKSLTLICRFQNFNNDFLFMHQIDFLIVSCAGTSLTIDIPDYANAPVFSKL